MSSSLTLSSSIRAEASSALIDALQTHGYCYVKHSALPPSLLSHMKSVSRRLFTDVYPALSEFQKESIKAESGFRGWYRYIGASGRDDAIDCFSMGRDDMADPSALRKAYYHSVGWEAKEYMPYISRQNPWGPLREANAALSDELRAQSRAYYDACHEVSMDVLRHVAFGLGIKPAVATGVELPDDAIDLEYFTTSHNKRDHNLEVKFYPQLDRVTRSRPLVKITGASTSNPSGPKVLRRKPAMATLADARMVTVKETPATTVAKDQPDASNVNCMPSIRLDSHSDLSTITILAQDALGGLEVFDDAKDTFVPAPVLEDAVLINAGTFLERWTGGMICATPHRVRSFGEQDRCSVVFFCFPNHDARIEPLLQREDNPALAGDDGSFSAGDMMPPLYEG